MGKDPTRSEETHAGCYFRFSLFCAQIKLEHVHTARCSYTRRRWLQDTSKRKLADVSIFFRPPLPVSPGSPEVDPMIDQNRRSE